jgi:mono/diheme cytochrome c family protein
MMGKRGMPGELGLALGLKWQWKARRSLLALAAMVVLSGGAAQAQNIDQGKSPTKLFADSCATCHRSPRGLAKGRFRLTLFAFLREHYSSGSASAWALTSYLESVDTPERGAAAKSSPRKSHSSPHPTAPVPSR